MKTPRLGSMGFNKTQEELWGDPLIRISIVITKGWISGDFGSNAAQGLNLGRMGGLTYFMIFFFG